MWFWLARIIRGRSQQERMRRGVDRGSVAMSGFMSDHPVSDVCISQCRLTKAIIRPWAREDGHSHLGGASQIVGNSISVGRSTFSIVRGLGFVGGRFHACELRLRAALSRHWLHMLRKLVGVLGLPSNR